MPKIKMIEAKEIPSIKELTFANADKYKDIFLTHRSVGSKAKIIGKFTGFDGKEYLALNNGHFMDPTTVRRVYRTDADPKKER